MSRHQAGAQIGVIADDFTGALDAGVEFVRAGFDTALLLRPPHPSIAVHVVTTDSRDGELDNAVARTHAAAALLAGHRLFKKIDSTMRGHVGAEIAALLDQTGLERAVVCPAAVEAGRVVLDGRLLVHGVPLDQTDFAHDPRWPARTARIGELIAAASTHVPLAVVRAGADALSAAIAAAPTRIVTVDASDAKDLAVIGAAAFRGEWLPCGALGLARAWAAHMAPAVPPPLAPLPTTDRPLLVVAGSRHPRTHAQLDRLLAARDLTPVEVAVHPAAPDAWPALAALLARGRSAVLRPADTALTTTDLQRRLVATLGALTAQACRELLPGALVLTGGETTAAVCHAAGTAGIHIGGEVEVGVPWSRIAGGAAHGLPIVTKAGGFGADDTLVHVYDTLREPRVTDYGLTQRRKDAKG